MCKEKLLLVDPDALDFLQLIDKINLIEIYYSNPTSEGYYCRMYCRLYYQDVECV